MAIHADQRLSRCASQSDDSAPMMSPIVIDAPEIEPNSAPDSRTGRWKVRCRKTLRNEDIEVITMPANAPPMTR